MVQTADVVAHIRVITVEDHLVTRHGVQACNARRKDIIVLSETGKCEESVCSTDGLLSSFFVANPSVINVERPNSRFWMRSVEHAQPFMCESAKQDVNVFVPERLSPRETEVLGLIVEGLTNKLIAAKLAMSLATAKTHVRHILNKLAVNDRTQAAVSAMRHGIV